MGESWTNIPSAGEPLATRLARLGAMLQDGEHKVLIADAVLALFEGEAAIATVAAGAPAATVPPPESFGRLYQRKVLDYVGASADVDLETVLIYSGFEAPWQSEWDGGGGAFTFNVAWGENQPRDDETNPTPDWRGVYMQYRQFTNDEASALLDSLTSS